MVIYEVFLRCSLDPIGVLFMGTENDNADVRDTLCLGIFAILS